MSDNKNKKSSMKRIILFSSIILVTGIIYFIADYFYLSKLPKRKSSLPKVLLQAKLISFVHANIIDIYNGVVKLNDSIILIENEIKRLEQITVDFPQEKKIVESEINIWSKAQKDLEKFLSYLEKEIESLYVQYLVNKEKGLEQLKVKAEELKTKTDTALDAINPLMQKLKLEEDRGLFNKIFKKNKS